MKKLEIVLLVSIAFSVVGTTLVYSPFLNDHFTYEDDNYSIVEGDIRVPKTSARSGLRFKNRLWPDRIIPYKITSTTFSRSELEYLYSAIELFYDYTCIRFYKATPSDKYFVSIGNSGGGCYATLGFNRYGRNMINLGKGCLNHLSTPVHEFLHVCGMLHEHCREDRDKWIKILWDNIDENQKGNFVKIQNHLYSDYGVPYNYDSVMHYPLNAFAKATNLNSMENLKPHTGLFGYLRGLNETDILTLHLMYNCTSRLS